MKHPKLLRITTVPQSLKGLLKGQLSYMKSNGFDVVGVSSPGEQNDFVRKNEGVEVREVAMSRQITPIKDLLALFKLVRIFRKDKPVIVHTHTLKMRMLLAKRVKMSLENKYKINKLFTSQFGPC